LIDLLCLTPLSAIFKLYHCVLVVEEAGVPGDNHRPSKQLVNFITCSYESSAPFL